MSTVDIITIRNDIKDALKASLRLHNEAGYDLISTSVFPSGGSEYCIALFYQKQS